MPEPVPERGVFQAADNEPAPVSSFQKGGDYKVIGLGSTGSEIELLR